MQKNFSGEEMKDQGGILKQFLSYKRAKNLLNKISKIKGTFWKVKLVEENEGRRSKRTLEVKIEETWWDADKFAQLIELIMEESVRFNLWVHGCREGHNSDLKINIEVKG